MPLISWDQLNYTPNTLPGQPDGMRAAGNIDLTSRPVVRNADGTSSTVLSMSIGTPDGEVLIPRISMQGAVLDEQQAIAEYQRTGQHLGIFSNSDFATSYAIKLHEDQANEYSDVQDPTTLDLMAAGLRQQNVVTNAYDLLQRDPTPAENPNYNPFDGDAADLAGFEQYYDRFIKSGSPGETAQIKNRIREEEMDRKTIAAGGKTGFAIAMAAATIDPLTLASMAIPVAAPEVWGSRVARIGAGVATQAALDTVSEGILNSNQELRTLQDSAFNIGADVLLTSVFGALATRVPSKTMNELIDGVRKDIHAVPPPEQSTAGAAAVGFGTTLEEESIAKGGAGIAATLGKVSPLDRLMRSPILAVRILTQKLADVPYLLNKHLRGTASPHSIEMLAGMRQRRGQVKFMTSLEKGYQDYVKSKPANLLSARDFGIEVSRAARRGDRSAIAEVNNVSRTLREIFDADRKELQALGALPEDLDRVLGAESYLPRVYDRSKIMRTQTQLRQVLREWFTQNPVSARARQAALEEGAPDVAAGIKPTTQLDAAEVDARVEDTMNHILGIQRGTADLHLGTPKPRILKTRVLDVPDEVLEPWLENDIERVMGGYFHSVSPQIEMRRMFGDVNIDAEVNGVKDAYAIKIRAAEAAGDNKLIAKLDEQMQSDIGDIDRLFMRAMGHNPFANAGNQTVVKTLRIARGINYVRNLGGQVASSFSDLGHVVTRYGAVRTAAAAVRMFTNLKTLKLVREDARRMSTALDWWVDTRGKTLAEIGDEPVSSAVDSFVRKQTGLFSRITLMAGWNTGLKFMASSLEQDAVIRALRRGDSIPKIARAKLAQHGIGDAQLRRMASQLEQFGQNDGGLFRARTDLWTDKEAAQLLEGAVFKAGELMTISKGIGDLPFIMDGEVAKTLLQFRSFSIASVNRIMIPVAQGLAHGDLATINGTALMLGFGYLSYYVKELAAGREPSLDPGRMTAEALNWSGMLGYVPDMWDPVAGIFHNAPRFSKFSDTRPLDTLMGPTFGSATQMYTALQAIGGGNDKNGDPYTFTQADLHALRKMLPYQNLFYLRRVINALEGSLGQSLDLEGAPKGSFSDQIVTTEKPKK